MKTYYYVYRPGTLGHRVKHDSLAAAEAEAKRLAVKHPGAVFEILQCLGIASTPVPAPSTFWLDGCEPVSARPVPAVALTNPRYTCTSFRCDWAGPQSEALLGEDPFSAGCQVIACPKCREQTLQTCCDEPGCNQPADTGTPTPQGYRSTCHKHTPK
jgi:hypothetical protein